MCVYVCVFFFYFFTLFFTIILQMGFLPWEIRVAFPRESQLPQSRATHPTVRVACFSVSIIQRTLTWITGSLTCAHTLVHATVYGHRKRVCTESGLWVKKTLPHREIEPASATCRSNALPTELHPNPSNHKWRSDPFFMFHGAKVFRLDEDLGK